MFDKNRREGSYLTVHYPLSREEQVSETIIHGDLGEIVSLDSLTSPCDNLREKFLYT
jgi:hypothetical protein